MDSLIAMTLLMVKHFVCDFPLQSFPYMFLNKGKYGHPGGILHALVHGGGTYAVLWWHPGALFFVAFDVAIHYHIDWAKMWTNNFFELQPATSHWFWILLGLDQLLHYLTYYMIVRMM
jgi:hypothetical protein